MMTAWAASAETRVAGVLSLKSLAIGVENQNISENKLLIDIRVLASHSLVKISGRGRSVD
jgi:hypothetical protein